MARHMAYGSPDERAAMAAQMHQDPTVPVSAVLTSAIQRCMWKQAPPLKRLHETGEHKSLTTCLRRILQETCTLKKLHQQRSRSKMGRNCLPRRSTRWPFCDVVSHLYSHRITGGDSELTGTEKVLHSILPALSFCIHLSLTGPRL